MSKWLDCEDDAELIEAEAECAEEEMATNWSAQISSWWTASEDDKVNLDNPPPVTAEDVEAAAASLTQTLELFSAVHLLFQETMSKLEGAVH